MVDDEVSLSWQAVPGDFVYYIVYSGPDGLAPFPNGWQAESPPTIKTTRTDPEPAAGRVFCRVTAVVVGN